MKSAHLFLIVIFLSAQPLLSDAQVYKWKDKDGSIRYTDTPPPSNIKQETIGTKKAVEPTGKAPLSPVETGKATEPGKMDATKPAPLDPNKQAPAVKDNPSAINAEEAAQIRRQNAEAEKRNKEEREAEAKRKADNCKAAKANFETYNQGGRIYKMNDKGEREYMGDNDLKAGKEQAQREMNENCS